MPPAVRLIPAANNAISSQSDLPNKSIKFMAHTFTERAPPSIKIFRKILNGACQAGAGAPCAGGILG
jgi:hypothetical protein